MKPMRRIWLILAVMLAAPAQAEIDPLLRPIGGDAATRRWLQPQEPLRIFGNTYSIGFGGVSVILIDTGNGLVLIDGALPQAVPAIEDNIRHLGFDIRQVKLILSSEPHYDHAGGLAALSRDSGALVLASRVGVRVLQAGRADLDHDDPEGGLLDSPPAVQRLRVVRDRQIVRLGKVALSALETNGHTGGSMSWSWISCENGSCLHMVFAASLTPTRLADYRFSDPAHMGIVANYRRSFKKIRHLRCNIMLSAHPSQSGGDEKFAGLSAGKTPNPYIDPDACRVYADNFSKLLDQRISAEAANPVAEDKWSHDDMEVCATSHY